MKVQKGSAETDPLTFFNVYVFFHDLLPVGDDCDVLVELDVLHTWVRKEQHTEHKPHSE
jgi:hypothetical protein